MMKRKDTVTGKNETPSLPDDLITQRQAAELCGLGYSTLRSYRAGPDPKGPPSVRIGNALFFSREQVLEWNAGRTRGRRHGRAD